MHIDFSQVNPEINKILEVLPTIYQLLDDSSFITVMDVEGTVLGFQIPNGAVPLKAIGEHLDDPSGGFDEVVRTGKRKYNYLPKEVLGEAFEGYLAPIKDNNKVVGVIIYTHSAGAKDTVHEISTEFKKTVNEIDGSLTDIFSGIIQINGILDGMVGQMTNIDGDVKKASSIVGEISGNASRSNILALNASIEAARSGENGKGFSVVATEMGKLANDSGTSSNEISQTLKLIDKDIKNILEGINQSDEVSKEHLDKVDLIRKKLSKCLSLANKLEESIK
ncbi:MAG: methyl-accepting chemotaxis protein [Lachnospiraceae bacterium]|nr:methyl-accepting chemotaxis protein [Lachnospiraceae bacterium]